MHMERVFVLALFIACVLGLVVPNPQEYKSSANVPEPGLVRLADNSLVPFLAYVGSDSHSHATRNVHTSRAPSELVSNGGFEAGLAPWTTTTNGAGTCDQYWTRASSGSASQCIVVSNPPGGGFALYSSFDGNGPKNYLASQTITIPPGTMNAVISSSTM